MLFFLPRTESTKWSWRLAAHVSGSGALQSSGTLKEIHPLPVCTVTCIANRWLLTGLYTVLPLATFFSIALHLQCCALPPLRTLSLACSALSETLGRKEGRNTLASHSCECKPMFRSSLFLFPLFHHTLIFYLLLQYILHILYITLTNIYIHVYIHRHLRPRLILRKQRSKGHAHHGENIHASGTRRE